MRLSMNELKNREQWKKAGILLPQYDVGEASRRAKKNPIWVHVGIGNIFRIFIGGIADRLLTEGLMDRGIICVESYDYEVIDKIFAPHDNLALSVTLRGDGSEECRILGAFSETVKAQRADTEAWTRLKEIFRDSELQMVSFTITEKGYALKRADGTYFDSVQNEINNGPEKAQGAMAVVTAMLRERYLAGQAPLALVSMDNCSQNGAVLRRAVLTIAEEWERKGYADAGFVAYVNDEERIAFPWTMIDKITPRPSDKVAEDLYKKGVMGMEPIVTSKQTYIAPFVNAEGPEYLVVEDHFPNGRPPLEKVGVYMTDRETVNRSERMKVTACLNPIHSALGPYGCVLGYERFADEMRDPELLALARQIGYGEGLPVAPNPGIFSPGEFLDEVLEERFPNPYLGDTPQRLSVDISQMLGIRFGETIQAYVRKNGSAKALIGIPLAIAGWLRYLLGVDDRGNPMKLAPDPMLGQLQETLSGTVFGDPESLMRQPYEILSNEHLFGINLYKAGIGERIELLLREEISGVGAVRRTLKKYLSGIDY
mgnify:FL=1